MIHQATQDSDSIFQCALKQWVLAITSLQPLQVFVFPPASPPPPSTSIRCRLVRVGVLGWNRRLVGYAMFFATMMLCYYVTFDGSMRSRSSGCVEEFALDAFRPSGKSCVGEPAGRTDTERERERQAAGWTETAPPCHTESPSTPPLLSSPSSVRAGDASRHHPSKHGL